MIHCKRSHALSQFSLYAVLYFQKHLICWSPTHLGEELRSDLLSSLLRCDIKYVYYNLPPENLYNTIIVKGIPGAFQISLTIFDNFRQYPTNSDILPTKSYIFLTISDIFQLFPTLFLTWKNLRRSLGDLLKLSD